MLIYVKVFEGYSFLNCALFRRKDSEMSVIWTIIIGFFVGVIAKFIMPGDKTEPKGFILTSVLGIVGALVATYLGQAVGWYKIGENAGFLASVVGAIILLFLYGIVAGRQGRA
jgi:uncharacterized membrane protein YeaQ/YmgE (transglycosylase-associated protein family)